VLGVKRTRPVLIALLIVAIALITIDFRDGGSSGAHSVGGAVFAPVERLSGNVTGWFRGGWFRGGGGNAEISALQKQNDQLRAQLAQAQVGSQNLSQLASVLHLTGKGGYKIVPASVIAAGGAYSDTVTIGAGSGDGITQNETVLNGDGLVGTVIATTRSTATVQLATDAGATVGIRMAGSGQIGALTGTADSFSGAAPLKLTLFSATATLKPGQELVTFGSVGGRPYVPGVPVGTVTTVTTEPGSLTPTALVQPFADFTGLGVLGVVISK
jgi:rod shape-determining protein MreC